LHFHSIPKAEWFLIVFGWVLDWFWIGRYSDISVT